MSITYFIDSENVGDNWIALLDNATKEDVILVFYTSKSPNMNYRNVILLKQSDMNVQFIECFEGSNALDFQLCTELGYRMHDLEENEFIIVSNDTGFDAVVKYWRARNKAVKRIHGKACSYQKNSHPEPKKEYNSLNGIKDIEEKSNKAIRYPQEETISDCLKNELIESQVGNPKESLEAKQKVILKESCETNQEERPKEPLEANREEESKGSLEAIGEEGTKEPLKTNQEEEAKGPLKANQEERPKEPLKTNQEEEAKEPLKVNQEERPKEPLEVNREESLKVSLEDNQKEKNDHKPEEEYKEFHIRETSYLQDNSIFDNTNTDLTESNTNGVDENSKEILYIIGKNNLQDLHESLKQLYGDKKSKTIYNAFKTGSAYNNFLTKHPQMSLREKQAKYCSIVFSIMEPNEVMPEDFPPFIVDSWAKKKNLNSLKAMLQQKYGREKSDRYYSLFKVHIKILHKIK